MKGMNPLPLDIICLNNCNSELEVEQVGTKAYNLHILDKNHYTIPVSYSITANFFYRFLEHNTIRHKIDSIIEKIDINYQSVHQYLSEIRMYIDKAVFSEEMLEELKKLYHKISDGSRLAVRSSSVNEDNANNSFAGLYTSLLDIESFEEILDAIKKVWMSMYSVEVFYYYKKNNIDYSFSMAVIIQQMVDFEKGGVLFSIDPTLGKNEGLIEITSTSLDKLVSGEINSQKFYFSRVNDIYDNIAGSPIGQLSKMALDIEKIFGDSVDIEWAYNQSGIVFLQVRPITSIITNANLDEIRIADIDDLDQINSICLNGAEELFNRWMRKKYHIRNHAKQNNIKIYIGYYIEYTYSLLMKNSDKIYEIINSFDTDYLFCDINMNLRGQIIRKNELIDIMISLTKNSKNDRETIRVRECIPTEVGGISSCTLDGNIYIEFAKGGLMGICSGYFAPSTYLVNEDGLILDRRINKQQQYYAIDENLSFSAFAYDGQATELTREQILEIIYMTKKMEDKFEGARTEWYIYNGELYFSDLSVENTQFTYNMSNGVTVISKGHTKGKIIVIPELKELEYFSHGYAISINKTDEFAKATESNTVKTITDYIKSALKDEPGILVTKNPYAALSLLFDYISGFVFTEGSILSHLGILLREAKKPALILPDALDILKQGDYYEIINSNIMKLEELEEVIC